MAYPGWEGPGSMGGGAAEASKVGWGRRRPATRCSGSAAALRAPRSSVKETRTSSPEHRSTSATLPNLEGDDGDEGGEEDGDGEDDGKDGEAVDELTSPG